jgi:hypothetical protein
MPSAPSNDPMDAKAVQARFDERYPSLTPQQEQLAMAIVKGASISMAMRMSGYKDWAHAANLIKNDGPVKQYIDMMRSEQRLAVIFGKEDAHAMLMEAWVATANATEMVKVVDSLTKLHGLNPTEPGTQVNVQLNIDNAQKTLESMSDAELLELAGKGGDYLEPSKG